MNPKLKILKAEIKSLAAQSLFLRREERIAYEYVLTAKTQEHAVEHDKVREGIHNYRVVDVREWARAAQLAYAMLRNKPYKYVEASSIKPLPRKIIKMAEFCLERYGDRKNITVSEWVSGEVLQ